MTCSRARLLLSAAMDDAAEPASLARLEAHLAGCRDCGAFAERLHALRRASRLTVAEPAPDIAGAVLTRLPRRAVAGTARAGRPPRHQLGERARPALVFLAAALAGAVFVGLGARPTAPVVAAGVPEAVRAAQSSVDALSADVFILERGWHPDVPVRELRGELRYAAPEDLWLRLRDLTRYPDGSWPPNHVEVSVNAERSWRRGVHACPPALQPGCAGAPSARVLERREPFDEAEPAPLDLVLPVRSFAHAAAPAGIGVRRLGGRPAVGVGLTVAHVQPLLDGLRGAGGWRALHPSDEVDLWLDAERLVPLALDVRAAATDARALWALRNGYDDPPDVAVLEVRLTDVRLNAEARRPPSPGVPGGAVARDAGFRRADVDIAPGWLPDGMRPHRAGVLGGGAAPLVEIAAWSDGRSWLKVRRTREWAGGRLFGDMGPAVRVAPLRRGVAYVDETATRVALHGAAWDVLVTGSLDERQLLRVAESLGVEGIPVPETWAEASSASLSRLPRGTLVHPPAEGFAPPVARIDGATVTLSAAGPGARGFTLAQAPGTRLGPPLEADVRAVPLRGVTARWSPQARALEWVEGGKVLSLRSRTLPLAELVALAEGLVRR